MPQNYHENLAIGKVLHSWKVKEYEQHSRRVIWYVIMSILGLLLVGYGIFTGNFLFSLIIIIFAIILFLQSHQEPIELPVGIAELGILINNRFYPYSELNDFYIIYSPPEIKKLFIQTRGLSRPSLKIELDSELDPNEIRYTLREYLEEDLDKEDEPFSEMFARKWQIH